MQRALHAQALLCLSLLGCLDADAPPEGRNKLEYYKQKFGSDRTAHMIPMMKVFYPLHSMLGSFLLRLCMPTSWLIS